MNRFVLSIQETDSSGFVDVGGKGANLGELSRIGGIRVPEGFCVTTGAYRKVIANCQEFDGLLDELAGFGAEDRQGIGQVSAKIRALIEGLSIPKDIEEEITGCLSRFGEGDAYAVRSSATAEDLPTASFAGQQDSFLNIIGREAILNHIRRCWASLFTDRAVAYRIQNGFGHRNVYLSVIVQKMVFPEVSGVLFTADPITGNRKVLSIDASFGLGEALVAGLVSPDCYKVREGKITDRQISDRKRAIYAIKEGGTREEEIEPALQNRQALTDGEILILELMARRIEGHFGRPQDIEWCLAGGAFYIVQSRPITTLFPIPDAGDDGNRVYVSVGHQQMMTDPMKPLGLSLFQLTSAASMYKAAGRLFVDITNHLASPAGRRLMVDVLGKSDPLIRDAIMSILERGDFVGLKPDDEKDATGKVVSPRDYEMLVDYDPAVVDDLIKNSEAFREDLQRVIETKSGPELIDFILEDARKLRMGLFDSRSFGVIMTAMNASSWINEKMLEWLDEKNVADTLTQSVRNNITSEMGLELLDVADVIRPHPEVVAYLQGIKGDDLLDGLVGLKGGQMVRDAIYNYLDRYGMRCAGEIDITRTRWSEKPAAIVPMILSNIRNFEPGAGKRKFEQGLQQALRKERELLDRLRQLPDGEQKVGETRRMIDLVRNLAGYREYPKYSIVSCYFIYKKALLKEAERLIQAGVIREKEDIYYLSCEELREAAGTNQLDYRIVDRRKGEYRLYEKLTPPRVITSDGEIITGKYRRENLPPGAIVGLPVSSGIAEGRARVILNMEDADLGEGDILVTPFTDPSWTPLFVSIKGLVTEVGGLMTHGAVIAREYGLPAVVGMENATRLIMDGQMIRVNGTEGYVEIL